jgi:hypothetical protein
VYILGKDGVVDWRVCRLVDGQMDIRVGGWMDGQRDIGEYV